ncbi:Zinc-finger domain of monoamine-oxidase A repressor R1 protein, putative isoform 2 [Hibiscus syriacus]|uniref:Zinc-finger domain of monoamine-oxidase A repressor R1 protein, putative isoform 2 n=1 Tax=Hibiscus syriacus TaxID=106335 RepID=A0A6A3CBE6_HIBSY|nr:Zinc-finger domain of monoamine-oxidase A repressor R1 protein, putative isoform 2 [Hibiscus syriacus]
MAISPSSKKKKNTNKSSNTNSTKTTRTTEPDCSTAPILSPKRRRNSSPGVRLIHNLIYDSYNGKTCHQLFAFGNILRLAGYYKIPLSRFLLKPFDYNLFFYIFLNCINGIDLPAEDVGHALQFLEFCEAFGEVLNMKKGQSQLLLSELFIGKSKRKNKLRILALVKIHGFKFLENTSVFSNSVKAVAERNMEKEMKKLQDEIAKAIIKKNGAPLFISENEALIKRIKSEVAQTLASTLEVPETVDEEGMLRDFLQLYDAERGLSIRCCSSEPVFQDGQGHKFLKFWRLSGYFGETDVQLQDIEVRDSVAAKERWYTYSTEQKAMVEKHISSFRLLAHVPLKWCP